MRVIIISLCACAYVSMLEFVLENFEVEYYNPKYYNVFNITMRKVSRRSPYLINVYVESNRVMGNHVMVKYTLYEVISGRHILTPVQVQFGLCDFFYKETYIGTSIKDQLPKNWSCPFLPGVWIFSNITLSFDKFPFIPFTYSSLHVRVCSVIEGYVKTELIVRYKATAVITQKLTDKDKKSTRCSHVIV